MLARVDVEYNETKFAEMVLLVAEKLRGDRAGGATKLNKVLFFAEFAHVRQYRRPISGCAFQKLAHGPAPHKLLPVRNGLIERGEAELVQEDFLGRSRHHLVPLRDADLGVFASEELQTINKVVDELAGMSANEVSELSHAEPGWQLTEVGEIIPYAAAFLGYPQVSTPASRQLAAKTAHRYGLTVSP